MKKPALWILVLLVFATSARAENAWKERHFTQPAPVVQAALKALERTTSGRLPLLEGFVAGSQIGLDRYQRPYYQCIVRISPDAGGGAVVRVAAKITAWDSQAGHRGYEALVSNGRLESDLLDRLEQALDEAPLPPSAKSAPATPPEISAPVPQIPRRAASSPAAPESVNPALEREAKNLEEILEHQSHPDNLVAVKQDLTPVLQNPSSGAKLLFLASAEDEFEILDLNSEWVHVRISGLARGWLRRSTVETLDRNKEPERNPSSRSSSPEKQQDTDGAADAPFLISSEEIASFPGSWAPLKGKSVRIVSIRPVPASLRSTSPEEKMRFAESELKKEGPSGSTAGVVLIFDAEDGGMVAAPRTALEQWKAGSLSDQRFWRECYVDPPEILGGGTP